MRCRPRSFVVLAFFLLSAPAARAQAPIPTEVRQQGASFWQAAAGVATTNWVTWAYNWYVQRWPWANVGVNSWGVNLRDGFVWDNDCFLDDQLAHPYHGSFYHNSARASGFGFWASLPFVAAGSATWELFGETITASINDLINTTLGGAALGEVTFRLSSLLAGGRPVGRNNIGRELAAFALSPMARAQGLLSARADPIRDPATVPSVESAVFAVGRQSAQSFLEVRLRYGDPFDAGPMRPYDAFEFRLQVTPDAAGIVHHADVSGLLARRTLSGSPRNRLLLGLYHHYNYDDFVGLQSSGNSVSAALLYQRSLGRRAVLNLSTHAEGILLGGISADQGFFWRRDYDMGPGVGARVGASLMRDGREWLRVDGRLWWLHSLHGSGGNHLGTFLRVGASVPVVSGIGLGGDLSVASRHSAYPDGLSVDRRVPHLRAYITWAPY
jgi:hypothetical protein